MWSENAFHFNYVFYHAATMVKTGSSLCGLNLKISQLIHSFATKQKKNVPTYLPGEHGVLGTQLALQALYLHPILL